MDTLQIPVRFNRVRAGSFQSPEYFYFTAGIVDTMLKKREEQR